MDIMRRIDQVLATTAEAYAKELEVENERLRTALRACTKHDPYIEDEYGIACVFCGKQRKFGHASDCSWVAAKKVLEEGR